MDSFQREVWKFPIHVDDQFTVMVPEGAEVLYVAVQNGQPWFWALVDPHREKEERIFYVHGTGHPVRLEAKYLGSFMLLEGAFVGHLFEPGHYHRNCD